MARFQRIVTILLLALFALQIYAQEDKQHDQNLMTVTLNSEQTKTAIEQPTQSKENKDVEHPENKKDEEKLKEASKEEKPKEVSAADSHKEENHKEENPKEGSPKEEHPKEEKPKEEKSKEEKPKEEKPNGENQKEEKPVEDKPKEEVTKNESLKEQKDSSTDIKESQSTEKKANSAGHSNKGDLHKSDYEEHEYEHGEHMDGIMEEHGGAHDEDHSAPFEDYMGEEIDQYLGDDHPSSRYDNNDLAPAPAAVEVEPIVADAAPNKTEPATPSGPRPPAPQITGCKTQGQIALTYSEGPSDVTAKIVRQLTKAEARANFFVNATWLYTQQYAMVVQNIYNAGHFIGMTYRVPNDDPASITDDQLRRDIINNAHTIESLISVSPKYVRLHYTEVKDVRTEGILQDLGFVIVGYNLDSQDYFKKDATGPGSINQIYEDTFVKYKDTYDAKGSFISIQYDLPYTGSLAAIPHIINTIEQEGYTMVRLDGCLNDATPYKKSANGTEYIGDKFSFGQSGYRQGQKSVTIESAAEAAEADEKFNMQVVEASMATTQQVSMSLFLVIIGVVFTLFL